MELADAELGRKVGEPQDVVAGVETARDRLHERDVGADGIARLAALAGAEAGGLGLVGGGEEADVFAQWPPGGTGRAAVDLRAGDGDEEEAVGGGAALLDGLPAGVLIEGANAGPGSVAAAMDHLRMRIVRP